MQVGVEGLGGGGKRLAGLGGLGGRGGVFIIMDLWWVVKKDRQTTHVRTHIHKQTHTEIFTEWLGWVTDLDPFPRLGLGGRQRLLVRGDVRADPGMGG